MQASRQFTATNQRYNLWQQNWNLWSICFRDLVMVPIVISICTFKCGLSQPLWPLYMVICLTGWKCSLFSLNFLTCHLVVCILFTSIFCRASHMWLQLKSQISRNKTVLFIFFRNSLIEVVCVVVAVWKKQQITSKYVIESGWIGEAHWLASLNYHQFKLKRRTQILHFFAKNEQPSR